MEYPTTMLDFMHQFPDDNACRAYLEKMRWPNGFVCSRSTSGRDHRDSARRTRSRTPPRIPLALRSTLIR